jgi:MipA family protein
MHLKHREHTMKHRNFYYFLMLSAGAGLYPVHGAFAQNDVQTFVAGGVMVKPDYTGSDSYEIAPLVYARIQKQNYYIETEGPGVKANILPFEKIEAGPLLSYNFGRDDVESRAVDRLRDIEGALEAGAFVKLPFKGVLKPSDELAFGAKFQTDISGEHDGTRISFGPSYSYSPAQNWRINTSVSATYNDKEYAQTFFGVDADNATRSGLSRYEAGAGLQDIGAMAVVNYAIDQQWGVTVLAGYEHLLGDAADSPIVKDAGSEHQVISGAGLSYRF